MDRDERPVVTHEDLVFAVAQVMAHVVFNEGFQGGIDGRADVEAAIEKEMRAKLSISVAQSILNNGDDPVYEMRVGLRRIKPGVFESLCQGFDLGNYGGRNSPPPPNAWLVAPPRIVAPVCRKRLFLHPNLRPPCCKGNLPSPPRGIASRVLL